MIYLEILDDYNKTLTNDLYVPHSLYVQHPNV